MAVDVITGYPECVDLRYFAASYNDKMKTQKLQEKLLITTALDETFFGIKNRPRTVNVDVHEDFLYQPCLACFSKPKDHSMHHYYHVNILDINQLFALRGSPMSCYFKYLRLLFTKNERCTDISKYMLHNDELVQFLKEIEAKHSKTADSMPVTYKLLFDWLQKAANKFAFRFSAITFKFLGTIFYWCSSNFMHRLIVSSIEIQTIKNENKKTTPIVYVLKNQSCIDWFLVLIVLVFCKLKLPVVLLHKDMNSALHWIYQKCGVVFIQPRREDLNLANLKATVYDESWLIYVEEHLKAGNHLMFHFDSPDGRHDNYLLETALDSIRRRAVADVLLAPVIVTSEKRPDKFPEGSSGKSLWFKLVDLFWRRKYNFGFVKINFLQPWSLREMMSALRGKTEDLHEMSQSDNTVLTTKVASHIAYDFVQAQPVMSTSLISFLLLKKFRSGVRFSNLVAEVDEARSDFNYLENQMGFTGSSELIIKHAVKILGPNLVDVKRETDSEHVIAPIMKIPNVLETANYANDTMAHLILNSVIMTSIAVIFKNELKSAFKDSNELKFSQYDVFDKARTLCDILQFEYAFTKPCQDLDAELNEAFCKFTNNNMFTKVEKFLTEEEEWGLRYARHLEDSDSFDDEYEDDLSPSGRPIRPLDRDLYVVNLDCEKSVFKEIMFYKNMLKPSIDAYVASAEHLNVLVGKPILDSFFHQSLTNKVTTMLSENQLMYAESLSSDLLWNSMKLFEQWQVVVSYFVGGIRLYHLTETYDNAQQLSSIVEKIKVFQ